MAKEPKIDAGRDGGQAVKGNVSLSDQAYERIKSEIFAQELLPREPLVEAQLSDRFGMSKTPVREALLALAREGLVEMTPYRGVRVRYFTEKDVREIYELRQILEPAALLRSVPNIDAEHLKSLNTTLHRAGEAAARGDRNELSRLNRVFHEQLFVRCENGRVIEVLTRLQDQLRLIALTVWSVQPTFERESQQHREILEAIERGDAELAAERLRAHIAEFFERYEARVAAEAARSAAG